MEKEKTEQELAEQNERELQEGIDEAETEVEKEWKKKGGAGPRSLVIHPESMDIERISTGLPSLDWAIGGGLPVGAVTEIFGDPSTGKSSIATNIAGHIQKEGGNVLWIDAEGTFEPRWARVLGLDQNKQFVRMKPTFAEKMFQLIEKLAKKEKYKLIVLDSIGIILPRAEQQGDYGDANMGVSPRLLSQVCRKITPVLDESRTTLPLINQQRMNLTKYGPPKAPPGGLALKHKVSIQIETKVDKDEKTRLDIEKGVAINITVPKNKTAPPSKACRIHIIHDKTLDDNARGIDIEQGMVEVARKLELITQNKAYYTWNDTSYHGIKNVIKAIKTDKELYAKLQEDIESISF